MYIMYLGPRKIDNVKRLPMLVDPVGTPVESTQRQAKKEVVGLRWGVLEQDRYAGV